MRQPRDPRRKYMLEPRLGHRLEAAELDRRGSRGISDAPGQQRLDSRRSDKAGKLPLELGLVDGRELALDQSVSEAARQSASPFRMTANDP